VSIALDRAHQGDCIAGMGRLDAGSADLVFADPPFNIGYDYDAYDDRQEREKYLAWSRDWMAVVHRVLKADGAFWLAIGDEYAAELKLIAQNVYREFELDSDPAVRFHCRSWVIWYYTFGVHCSHKFTRSHAHLFHFVKDPKRFTFNGDAVRVPSARQLVYKDRRANPKGRMPDDTWIIPPEARLLVEARGQNGRASVKGEKGEDGAAGSRRAAEGAERVCDGAHAEALLPPTAEGFVLRPQDIPNNFRADEDAWYFSRVAGTFRERQGWHGCQMPEQLLGRIIRVCSNAGEVVLDPFAGSGTTLAVAKKLGRRHVGFELSKDYALQASERLASIREGDPLVGAEDPIRSAPPTSGGRQATARPRREERSLF